MSLAFGASLNTEQRVQLRSALVCVVSAHHRQKEMYHGR